MASKKTLKAKNLEILGGPRLAQLLFSASDGNTVLHKQLRMEIQAALNPKIATKRILKRLTSIRGQGSQLTSKKTLALGRELGAYRELAQQQLISTYPHGAFQLLLTIASLEGPLDERVYDVYGTVSSATWQAALGLGELSKLADTTPEEIATAVFDSGIHEASSRMRDVIESLETLLERDGLRRLQSLYMQERKRVEDVLTSDPKLEYSARRSIESLRKAVCLIADTRGDADGFIEQYSAEERHQPDISASIADRLFNMGRYEESLAVLDAAVHQSQGAKSVKWMESRVSVLEAMGEHRKAEKALWDWFRRSPEPKVLRAILRHYGDEERAAVEQRAIELVQSKAALGRAAVFLIEWGLKGKAARLIVRRAAEVSEIPDRIATSLADEFGNGYPLAATLLYRKLLTDLVRIGYDSVFKDAADYFIQCQNLAGKIYNWGTIPPHTQFQKNLRKRVFPHHHFWGLVRSGT